MIEAELKARVREGELPGALDALRSVLRELSLGDGDLTGELYTGAVDARRSEW